MNEIGGKTFVKATDLNRGKASSCIKTVHDTNCDAVILKNSEPYAVIISIEKYNQLISMAEEQEKRVMSYAEKIIKE